MTLAQSPSRALEGVRVLDLTRLLPGPYATYILAGYGADVVKVEDAGAGDYARHSPPLKSSGAGAAFTAANAGKRSIALDLKDPEHVDAFMRLVDTADVLVESFRPGVMARLGLGHEELRARHPGLVYCSISGFGQASTLAGHDLNFQSLSGLLAQRPTGAVPFAHPPALLGDLVGGSYSAVIAIMAAVLDQRAGRGGRFIDISITHGAMGLMPMETVAALNDETPPPFGESHLTGAHPFYGVYSTADGREVALGALEPKFWRAFCEHAGAIDLVDAGGNPMDASRHQVRERLDRLFKTRTAAEWEAFGREHDCCLTPVLSVREAVGRAGTASQPAISHHWQRDGAPPVRVLKGVSADLADPPRRLCPPPRQGEHTQEVLAAAGLPADHVERIARKKPSGA
ncbi:CaiB/BaiF CoA-transferase family protein [Variovorax sp.]|uniref:CaiB/BaiF CoA transferase family protein n=1 Tax=Variovorax sp. TaxID=1871043 RepID=UPI002D4648C3|nr:CaiB/BaiF CoA-transferase family protein [Variovorax sp.]HYP84171.1 CaiB/BaiF CoA-transferase family protein [Variovorax sp.]